MVENNREKPFVDILIVTYNQEKYIKEAIESAAFQTYPNIKIIVADDCSKDKTREIIDDLYNLYPEKIIKVYNEKNLGITGNCNVGLKECKGDFLVIMGGDDILSKEKIERQVSYMLENTKCDICYHDMLVYYGDNATQNYNLSTKIKPREGLSDTLIKYGTFLCATAGLVNRSSVPANGFEERLKVASDLYFWIEVLESKKKEIHYIPEVLGKYRRHDNNVTKGNISLGLTDHLLTAGLVMSKYPHLSNYAINYMAHILRRFRRKEHHYCSYLLASIRLRFSIVTFFMIVMYVLFRKKM